MYRTIKHWEDSAYSGKDPDWIMDLTDIIHINLWGGNYGCSSCGIYKETNTNHIYYITDWGHGQYDRKRLEHLEDKHISEIASMCRTLLFKNLIKQSN